jgi:hypothetical protein
MVPLVGLAKFTFWINFILENFVMFVQQNLVRGSERKSKKDKTGLGLRIGPFM